jgi:hypothetical protein
MKLLAYLEKRKRYAAGAEVEAERDSVVANTGEWLQLTVVVVVVSQKERNVADQRTAVGGAENGARITAADSIRYTA